MNVLCSTYIPQPPLSKASICSTPLKICSNPYLRAPWRETLEADSVRHGETKISHVLLARICFKIVSDKILWGRNNFESPHPYAFRGFHGSSLQFSSEWYLVVVAFFRHLQGFWENVQPFIPHLHFLCVFCCCCCCCCCCCI